MSSAKESLLLLLPTAEAFHREERLGAIEKLERMASQKGIEVRVLSPVDREMETKLRSRLWQAERDSIHPRISRTSKSIRFQETSSSGSSPNGTILVVDSRLSLAIELKDNSKPEFENAIGLATFPNSKSTTDSYSSIFEHLWRESELREEAERNRRQPELLQNILAHDIRNYNQAARLSAEILEQFIAGKQSPRLEIEAQ